MGGEIKDNKPIETAKLAILQKEFTPSLHEWTIYFLYTNEHASLQLVVEQLSYENVKS